MRQVIVWRCVGSNDLEFVCECSKLSAMFAERGPDIRFEIVGEEGGQLLNYNQFLMALGL